MMNHRFRSFMACLVVVSACWPFSPSGACSIFTVVRDGQVLMGNNEDFIRPGVIWFVPARKNRLGRVNVGFDTSFAQGSMNEKGLAFDGAALAPVAWEADSSKKTHKNIVEKIMNECGTVVEAIEYFESYNAPFLRDAQIMFADATGDSVVVAYLSNKGITYTRGEGDHHIVTNNRLEESGYRDQRFMKSEQVLTKRGDSSLETMKAVMNAVHQRGPGGFTSYSTVYNLKERTVHLYNLSDFERVLMLDLKEELTKGKHSYTMVDLFEGGATLADLKAGDQRTNWDTRITLDQRQLEKLTGVYVPAENSAVEIRIEPEGKGLKVIVPGQPDASLFPETETVFRIAPDRGQVSFQLDARGLPTGFTLHRQIDLVAKRVRNL